MNPWCALAGSLVCVTVLVAGCSSDSSNTPAGQAGQAGTSAGGGQSGASSQAGSGQAAGNAGSPTGGNPHAGTAGTTGTAGTAGANAGGSTGAGDGGSAGEAPSGPYRAVIGEFCPVEGTLGVVELRRGPPLSFQVALYDQFDPWIGEAALTTPTCEFHRFTGGGCAGCVTGEMCSALGRCVSERRTIKDASLQISTGSEQRLYTAEPNRGDLYGMLDIGDASSSFAMTLSWGDTQIILDPMPVASGELVDLAVDTENSTYDMPGPLDATWQPPGDGAFVRTRIPINHHAGGHTFTDCHAPTSAGAFHADAEMIDPLSVQTGLEFQGIDHIFVAAAHTPQGCVEFRFGDHMSVIVNDLDF